MVGPRLNTSALRTKLMPLVPLSIVFDSAPVCLLRWNAKSRLWRCRKTFFAILRIEFWATFPNTAFLASLNNAAPALEMPSRKGWKFKKKIFFFQILCPWKYKIHSLHSFKYFYFTSNLYLIGSKMLFFIYKPLHAHSRLVPFSPGFSKG